jgi:hypothetical protein
MHTGHFVFQVCILECSGSVGVGWPRWPSPFGYFGLAVHSHVGFHSETTGFPLLVWCIGASPDYAVALRFLVNVGASFLYVNHAVCALLMTSQPALCRGACP